MNMLSSICSAVIGYLGSFQSFDNSNSAAVNLNYFSLQQNIGARMNHYSGRVGWHHRLSGHESD